MAVSGYFLRRKSSIERTSVVSVATVVSVSVLVAGDGVVERRKAKDEQPRRLRFKHKSGRDRPVAAMESMTMMMMTTANAAAFDGLLLTGNIGPNQLKQPEFGGVLEKREM